MWEEPVVSIIDSTTNVPKPEWGPQYPEKMAGTDKYDPTKGKAERIDRKIKKQWSDYIEREYEK